MIKANEVALRVFSWGRASAPRSTVNISFIYLLVSRINNEKHAYIMHLAERAE